MSTLNDIYRILFGRSGTTKGSDIDMAEHGRAGGDSSGQPFKFTDTVDYAVKITEDGTDTYIGVAKVATAESTAGWKCLKISESGSDTLITWADGNEDYDNTASDLTAHSYS